jgi:hypothetical protein
MELEVEIKIKQGWMLALGALLGLGIGYAAWGRRLTLERVGGQLRDRSRRAIDAARNRLSSTGSAT